MAEFSCRCGSDVCAARTMRPHKDLVDKLQLIRNRLERPLTITSGIRCHSHNHNVGGSAGSYHLRGEAADIVVPDEITEGMALRLYALADYLGLAGVGLYGGKTPRVHVDVRDANKHARWVDKSWSW